ncbi:MAG: hypothetical protein K2N13_03860 [Paraprevotella sp.]|nr:hypothetical protein [Paraprevotella sp.]
MVPIKLHSWFSLMTVVKKKRTYGVIDGVEVTFSLRAKICFARLQRKVPTFIFSLSIPGGWAILYAA